MGRLVGLILLAFVALLVWAIGKALSIAFGVKYQKSISDQIDSTFEKTAKGISRLEQRWTKFREQEKRDTEK